LDHPVRFRAPRPASILQRDLRFTGGRRRKARPALLRDPRGARRRTSGNDAARRRPVSRGRAGIAPRGTAVDAPRSARSVCGVRREAREEPRSAGDGNHWPLNTKRAKTIEAHEDHSDRVFPLCALRFPSWPSRLSEEKLVRGILMLLRIRIPQLFAKPPELDQVAVDDLEAGEHATEVRAVIAIVEQADVPAPPELLEKLRQRAGTLGKLEPAEPLAADARRMATDH